MRGKLCMLMALILLVLLIPLGAMGEDISTFDVWYGNKHFWTEKLDLGDGSEYDLLAQKKYDSLSLLICRNPEKIRAFENSIVFLSKKNKTVYLVEVDWSIKQNMPEMYYVCDNSDCNSLAFYSGITEVGTYGQKGEYFYILSLTKNGVEMWTQGYTHILLAKGGTKAGRFHDIAYSFSSKSKELAFLPLYAKGVKPQKHKLLGEPQKAEAYLGWLEKSGLTYLTPAGELKTVKLDKGVEVVWFQGCMVLKQGSSLGKVLPGAEPVSLSQQEFDQLMKSEALIATDKP